MLCGGSVLCSWNSAVDNQLHPLDDELDDLDFELEQVVVSQVLKDRYEVDLRDAELLRKFNEDPDFLLEDCDQQLALSVAFSQGLFAFPQPFAQALDEVLVENVRHPQLVDQIFHEILLLRQYLRMQVRHKTNSTAP